MLIEVADTAAGWILRIYVYAESCFDFMSLTWASINCLYIVDTHSGLDWCCLLRYWHQIAVVILCGRPNRLPVRLSRTGYNLKTKWHRVIRIGVDVPQGMINRRSNCRLKKSKGRRSGGRPHNMSALDRRTFLVLILFFLRTRLWNICKKKRFVLLIVQRDWLLLIRLDELRFRSCVTESRCVITLYCRAWNYHSVAYC